MGVKTVPLSFKSTVELIQLIQISQAEVGGRGRRGGSSGIMWQALTHTVAHSTEPAKSNLYKMNENGPQDNI